MNILIVNDDGPGTIGTEFLRKAVKDRWPRATHIITLTPDACRMGFGMAMSAVNFEEIDLVKAKTGKDRYQFRVRPVSLVYIAFMRRDLFLPGKGNWDLVVSGINYGKNVGFDVYHSGTVGQAFVASTGFRTPAWAFSQDIGEKNGNVIADAEEHDFQVAYEDIAKILREAPPSPGEVFNVNFPMGKSEGIRYASLAHYSAVQTPPVELVPRAAQDDTDVVRLQKGFTTISRLELRAGPALGR